MPVARASGGAASAALALAAQAVHAQRSDASYRAALRRWSARTSRRWSITCTRSSCSRRCALAPAALRSRPRAASANPCALAKRFCTRSPHRSRSRATSRSTCSSRAPSTAAASASP
jgi:hypothetical protein